MAARCDLVLVIGSRNSSNSVRLVEVARDCGTEAHLIDNRQRGARGVARGQARRGRLLGASAPDKLVQELLDLFRARGVRDEDIAEFARGARGRALHAPQADPRGRRRRREPSCSGVCAH